MSIYDYHFKSRDGSDVSMEQYRGKVLLIVNKIGRASCRERV